MIKIRIMGKLKFFGLLLAAGMFAACSDNLENAGNGNEGDTLTGEKGYVNIGINLPTTNGSSRAYSDDFHDGDAAEYKVNDVIIALFYDTEDSQGEANATCRYAFKLTSNDFSLSGEDDDNITSYYASGVRMIAAPEDGGSVYALALVNPPSIFGISGTQQGDEDGGNSVLTTKLIVSGVTSNPTLEQLNKALTISAISDVVGNVGTPDFFMTNAPIANKTTYQYTTSPSEFKVTTLAPVIIHNSKAAAEAAANDSPIYVERVVAKAQVNIGNNAGSPSNNPNNDNTLKVTSDVPSYANATVTFEGWKLQTTNKKYYPVRRVNELSSGETVDDWNEWSKYNPTTNISSNNNRFFGNTPNPFRTYWGIDPNYTSDEAGDYNVIDTETASITWNGVGYGTTESEIEYCLENTTSAQTMESERLTSVLLKGTFKPNGASTGANDDFFMKDNTSAIYTKEQLLVWATDVLNKSEEDGVKLGNSESITYQTSMPTAGTTITDAAGILTIFNIPGETGAGNVQEKRTQALIKAAGNNIKYYKGGVTYYYATVIEHFGPDAPATEINSATDYTEANHLGRFGVLRNNWYVLTINSVSGPGEPDVPEGGGVNPPDKQQSYINCQINVLSWAKRSQGVDLQ